MKVKKLLTSFAIASIILFAGCVNDDFEETVGVCPIVISTDPANGDVAVPLDQIITATFNEEMNPATITESSFTLSDVNGLIGGTVTYSGTTAIFTPDANLTPNTTYSGVIKTSVKDMMGNALQEDYVWTFSTGANIRPMVVLTDPANNATGVFLNKIVTATFNMPMDQATINDVTFTIMQGTTPVAGTVSYSGTTAYFTPTVLLAPNTIYTATITTGAKNLSGTSLAANYVWNFTTGAITAPKVISTDPISNATGVNIDKTITATFDMPMDPLTINNITFTLKQGTTLISGVVTYLGSTASFNPANDLLPNTTYTATITTGAKNLAGVSLANNYVWNFSTSQSITTIDLGDASVFGAFGGNAGITNQGLFTVINNGSIATTAASTLVTGFRDGTTGDVYTVTPLNDGLVSGRIYTAPPFPGNATSEAIATQGLIDANIAYNSISPASKPGGIDPGAGELGGLTLPPGIYKSDSGTFNISNGNLTLDAQGDPNAEWIFQTAAGLTVGIAGPAGARSINMINGASASNVYWYVGSTAVINYAGGGVMVGTIIAYGGVTLSSPGNSTNTTVQTVLNGRAISLVASVTMVNTIINVPN
ncbi:MAG: Ig-like domain-containing protein [Flavobacterium sp.]